MHRPRSFEDAELERGLHNAQLVDRLVVEGHDCAFGHRTELAEHVQELVFEPWVERRNLLELDHQPDLAERELDHLLQERDLLAITCVELAQLGRREVFDQPAAVGGAVEGVVVNDDEATVGRKVHVAFDEVAAGGDGGPERPQSVLRILRRVAAVAAYQRPPLIMRSLVTRANRLSQDARSA